MGFDAIWISPIVKNAADSYHGYFTTDFEQLNPHFGTEHELKAMVQAAHDRDILVMVDVVANHVAFTADVEGEPEDYTRINPLNKLEYYHKACKIQDWNDKWQLENCRLCGLPDLDQEHPYVKSFLHKWVKKLVKDYDFDAIRIDAVAHVKADFWPNFVSESGVFAMGEVLNGGVEFVAPYQQQIPGVFNFPLHYIIKKVWGREKGSMWEIVNTLRWEQQKFVNMDLLGVFVDNHDMPRFLSDY